MFPDELRASSFFDRFPYNAGRFRYNLPPALLLEWPGSFTCHCSNIGVEQAPNKSQHTKLTLEKKILPPRLPGFELVTFRWRVWSSANKLSRLSYHWLPCYWHQLTEVRLSFCNRINETFACFQSTGEWIFTSERQLRCVWLLRFVRQSQCGPSACLSQLHVLMPC